MHTMHQVAAIYDGSGRALGPYRSRLLNVGRIEPVGGPEAGAPLEQHAEKCHGAGDQLECGHHALLCRPHQKWEGGVPRPRGKGYLADPFQPKNRTDSKLATSFGKGVTSFSRSRLAKTVIGTMAYPAREHEGGSSSQAGGAVRGSKVKGFSRRR